MHEYSGEKLDLIEQDVDRIRTQWLILNNELENGIGPIHLPPAVTVTAMRVCELFTNLTVDSPEDAKKIIEISGITLVNFGALMFALGQRTANAGILASNMTQCDCADITDEAIENLINGTK